MAPNLTGRPFRRCALALALAAALGGRYQAGPAEDSRAELARILGRSSAPGGALAKPAEVRAALVAGLAGAAQVWLDVRGLGTLPCDEGEVPLTLDQEDVLRLAAPLLKRSEVLLAVQGVAATGDAQVGVRLAALELLRIHGLAGEVDLMCALAAPGAAAGGSALETSFEVALADVLVRDEEAYDALEPEAERAPGLCASLARAVGRAGHPRGLAWLAGAVNDGEAGDAALLEVERLAPLAPAELVPSLAPELRPILREPNAARRKHAMRALGSLRDEASLPDLLAILEAGERGERQAAHAALCAITGRALPPQADVWLAWYEAELRWQQEERPSVLEQLWFGPDAEVIAAARSLSEHGLLRKESAVEFARLLDEHPSPAVRDQACQCLARLGTRFELEALVRALDDDDQGVRLHAHAALCMLTGLELTGDSAVWDAALNPG